MTPTLIAALFFTVALLVITAYFIFGSIPLLILQHDTPMDARFVRSFFNTYYLAAMAAASCTALSYALAGRFAFALGAAGIALVAALLRRRIIPAMDALGAAMQAGAPEPVQAFRRTHLLAILVNVVQLALLVLSLTAIELK